MPDLALTLLLFVILLASAWVGFAVQARLHERHVAPEKVESVRLLFGMLLTFTALVLGLLTQSAKNRFDGYENDLSAYAADLIELDHRLRMYGAEADDIRKNLRRYTAAAIADTWPDELRPTGDYPQPSPMDGPRSVEAISLGDMLTDIDFQIEKLQPADTFHLQVASRLRDRLGAMIQKRWQLILSARSTISWPFLAVLTVWLAVIFAIFALTAPRDGLVYVVIVLSALSIVSPVYLILDYSGPQSGLLQLSSDAMRTALAHMDRTR